MKNQTKKGWLAVMAGVVVLASGASAQAQTPLISEHFYFGASGGGYNASVPFSAGTSAGLDAATNWNSLNIDTNSDFNTPISGLVDSTGAGVSLSFELSGTNANRSNAYVNSFNGNLTANQQLEANFAMAGTDRNDGSIPGAGSSLTLTIDNIPYTSYGLIIYLNSAQAGTSTQLIGALTLNGSTYYYEAEGAVTSATPFTQITDTTSLASATRGDYIEIMGLTSSSQVATLLDESSTGNIAPGIAGFQIVDEPTPEPSTLSAFLVGGFALVSWRLRRLMT